MSSVWDNKDGSFAVDGVHLNPHDTMAHSKTENNPWLRVDLGSVHCIWAVRILNRGLASKSDVEL